MRSLFALLSAVVTQVSSNISCNSSPSNPSNSSTAGIPSPWCIPKNYDRKKPPFLFLTEGALHQMNIHYTFSIREVSEVVDNEQTLKIPMYFTVSWTEERLDIDQNSPVWSTSVSGPANQSTEDAETLNLLWKPNLEIYGLQEFKKQRILGEMAGLRISRSKEVTFDIKVTIEISCLMDFSDYPFDDHTCSFQVGSYFYDKNSVTCSSTFQSPKRSTKRASTERALQHTTEFSDLSRSKRTVRLASGQYAACGFQIYLKRKHQPMIYQIYIPCCLFVMVSWISFIIDPKVIPGRMSLLVILFLVIINIFNNVRSQAPLSASSRLNAIDQFIMSCIFMIFSAIAEYAIILSIYTLELDKRDYQINHEKPAISDRVKMILKNPRKLDLMSIITFSISFFLYLFDYWVITNHDNDYES